MYLVFLVEDAVHRQEGTTDTHLARIVVGDDEMQNRMLALDSLLRRTALIHGKLSIMVFLKNTDDSARRQGRVGAEVLCRLKACLYVCLQK